ncbi:MAG: hypothetical protein DWQ07_23080 [Chloroflexi bacterium]|nr:MAG: hypothetical protein DWQ07_23080 [Chloroflexota bacterium]MBL1194033.1 hypothetical protein [Chloroflexota bacterium]NOH11327.1 hypothetical protein [Chloroflexota bacterium]
MKAIYIKRYWISILALLVATLACSSVGQVAQPTLENAEAISIVPQKIEGPPVSGNLQIEAGGQLELRLATLECCVFWETVEASADWSLADAPKGVEIDTQTGLLTADDEVGNGATFTVQASVSSGQQVFEEKVTVYSLDGNPLVGIWTEKAQQTCDTYDETSVEEPIGELIFSADGSLSVTWRPFEAYIDYVGEYSFDTETIKIQADGVNYLPENIDGTGTYLIDDQGRLILSDIWLGSPPFGSATTPLCGHIFTKK